MATERRLKSQEDCRRALAWVFRQVEKDIMAPAKGRVLIYAALTISGILAEHDIESRIEAIEHRMVEREKR